MQGLLYLQLLGSSGLVKDGGHTPMKLFSFELVYREPPLWSKLILVEKKPPTMKYIVCKRDC